jgi:hypothetical protein
MFSDPASASAKRSERVSNCVDERFIHEELRTLRGRGRASSPPAERDKGDLCMLRHHRQVGATQRLTVAGEKRVRASEACPGERTHNHMFVALQGDCRRRTIVASDRSNHEVGVMVHAIHMKENHSLRSALSNKVLCVSVSWLNENLSHSRPLHPKSQNDMITHGEG